MTRRNLHLGISSLLWLVASLGCQKTDPKFILPTATYSDPGSPVMVGGGKPVSTTATHPDVSKVQTAPATKGTSRASSSR
jgi:hypothetical protein